MLNFKINNLYFYFVLLLLALQIKAQSLGTSQNQLINPSFEIPVQNNIGNNIITWPINGWNGSGANPNIVKTNGSPSTGGPNNAKQGVQYLDVVGSSADFYQEFNFQCNTQVFFSGYFSVRDNRASTGRIDLLRINSNNTTTLVASSNQLNMPSTANIWYLSSGSAILLPGKYRFNITMGEDSNFDDACFSFNYPTVNSGSYGPLCENNGSITLTGTPTDSFGTWSGSGIVDNGNGTASFNPSGLGGTIVTATYSHYNASGFGCTESTNIIVNPSVNPIFNQIEPICFGDTLNPLPTTSINGITGTWSPAINNTSTTTYTFTPLAGGQCKNAVTMTIIVNPKITPTFTQVPAICSGATINTFPTTSTNGITGSWSPEFNNTATTRYTFTPNPGQCATTATMTISVNPITTPQFTPLAAICSGATLTPLPTTSTNGITGTWSPSLNNEATTTYTFTPDTGQCALNSNLTVEVKVTPIPSLGLQQIFCTKPIPTIAQLNAIGSAIKWYNSANAVNSLSLSTPLIQGQTYFASQTIDGCESVQRLEKNVDIINCDVVIFNSIKVDAQPMSDRLYIDNISYFPNNSIQIFNRYGRLVWETKGYNNDSNAFKGKANVPDLFQKDEQLPAGTYFYILNYFNFIDRTQKEKNGYLQLFNGN
jgi:hypothetical protein